MDEKKLARRGCMAWMLGAAVTTLAGLSPSAFSQTAQTGKVEIGFAAPLTGNSANYGKDLQMGAELAVSEANDQKLTIGGRPITFEVMAQDDQGDPRVAVQVAQRLVDGNVAAVIGHFNSGTTIAASTVYNRGGVVQVIPAASNPSITHQGFKLMYRPYGTDNTVASSAARYAVKVLKAKRIAVVDDRTAYGQGLADEFEQAVKAEGSSLVTHEYTSDTAVDFRAILTTLKGKRADLVFFAGLGVQGSLFVKQARQLGYDGKLMAGATFATPSFIKLAGDAANGMIALEQGAQLSSSDDGRAFLKRFHDKFGTDPVGYAGFAYNATWTAINGMKLANSTDPKVFGPAMSKLTFTGIYGPVAFDANGDLKHARTTLYRDDGGKWVFVETATAND